MKKKKNQNKWERRIGICFMAGGMLLLTAALLVGEYVFLDESIVKASTKEVLEQIDNELALEETETATETKTEDTAPLFAKYPNVEMPVAEIDGHYYIGRLDIPELELSLPVMDEWDVSDLEIAPCRYQGSVYQGDMVIAAQGYKSQFGTLKNLREGSRVIFTDMDGNSFLYDVTQIEQLPSDAVEEIQEGEWALTLFTCTTGGAYQIVVHCVEAAQT